MNDSGQSGGRSGRRRRGRRRPRRSRGAQPSASQEEMSPQALAESQTEESPSKNVFIYTYTIRKGG